MDICIYLINERDSSLKLKLYEKGIGCFALSAITIAELSYGAYWIIQQGEEIVPYLDQILGDYEWPAKLGDYPYAVLWALGRIGGDEAEQVLLKHADKDEFAELALKGLRSREYN